MELALTLSIAIISFFAVLFLAQVILKFRKGK